MVYDVYILCELYLIKNINLCVIKMNFLKLKKNHK